MAEKFAVLDTETNWDNEVMSVGVVIAEDGEFESIDEKYITQTSHNLLRCKGL